jgi:choline dehydrogenase-like flavoprotein
LLDSEFDVDTLERGIRTMREIMKKGPIAQLIHEEIAPGPSIESSEALRVYIRDHCRPCCHPMGTCRMGADDDAVVDPELRVRGTENLWIADASIMPEPLNANPNALCMMIGAKLGMRLATR